MSTGLLLATTVTLLTAALTTRMLAAPARCPGQRLVTTPGPSTVLVRARRASAGLVATWTQRHHRRRIAARLPDAVELLVMAVQSGSPPSRAVHDVAALVDESVRPGFDAVVHRLERGRRLADAITALPEMLGPAAAPVADAITAADRYGTPLGPVLDGLASDARDDRRRHAEARARRLPVRLSFPLVVCTLPSFVLLAIVPALLGALAGLPASPLSP